MVRFFCWGSKKSKKRASAPAPAPVLYRDMETQTKFPADHEPKSDLAFDLPHELEVLDELFIKMLNDYSAEVDKLLFLVRTPLETSA